MYLLLLPPSLRKRLNKEVKSRMNSGTDPSHNTRISSLKLRRFAPMKKPPSNSQAPCRLLHPPRTRLYRTHCTTYEFPTGALITGGPTPLLYTIRPRTKGECSSSRVQQPKNDRWLCTHTGLPGPFFTREKLLPNDVSTFTSSHVQRLTSRVGCRDMEAEPRPS